VKPRRDRRNCDHTPAAPGWTRLEAVFRNQLEGLITARTAIAAEIAAQGRAVHAQALLVHKTTPADVDDEFGQLGGGALRGA
jgi:hypothetical protein